MVKKSHYLGERIARTVLFVFIFSLIIPFFSAEAKAEDLKDIYDAIADKYPNEINTMITNGATESDIRNFIDALEVELKKADSLTDANIKGVLANATINLYLSGDHTAVFDAVFKGWNLSVDQLLDAFYSGGTDKVLDLLPKSFLEIGKLVKEKLLESPDGGQGGGSGGGTGSSAGEPAVPVGTQITNQINSGAAKITLKMGSGTSLLEITAKDLEKVFAAGKSLEIIGADEDVLFTIPAKAFSLPETGSIEVRIEKLTSQEMEKMTEDLGNGSKRVSPVFYLDMKAKDGNQYIDLTFHQPVQVGISYGDTFVTNTEENNLEVYYYNDSTKQWQFIGGKVDQEKKTVTWSAVHFSKYAVMTPGETKFSDLSHHWAQGDIEFLAGRGIVKGIGGNKYAPNKNVTRAEFTTLLINLLGISEAGGQKEFSDIPKGAWYEKNIQNAVGAGLVNGINEKEFAPNRLISRQEMAVMVVNALKYRGISLDGIGSEQLSESLGQFKDKNLAASWAQNSLATALKFQIMKGRATGLLAPQDFTTRAESAVMIKRILDTVNK